MNDGENDFLDNKQLVAIRAAHELVRVGRPSMDFRIDTTFGGSSCARSTGAPARLLCTRAVLQIASNTLHDKISVIDSCMQAEQSEWYADTLTRRALNSTKTRFYLLQEAPERRILTIPRYQSITSVTRANYLDWNFR